MTRIQLFLILIVTTLVTSGRVPKLPRNCCPSGKVLDDNLRCTNRLRPKTHVRNGSEILWCYNTSMSTQTTHVFHNDGLKGNPLGSIYCLNRSMKEPVLQACPVLMNKTTGCDGILTTIKFWGADIAMYMNIIHVVFCFIVVILYLVFSDLGRRTYNRAVLRHNACLLAMGCTLTILGVFTLCHEDLNDIVTVILWLILQFFTLASATWLNVICFDMTLVITRFRWMFGSFDNSEREENRKFLIYGIFAWGGAAIPTLFVGIIGLCPAELVSSAIRVDYTKYHEGPNTAVNMYFFFIPLLTLFLNNVLFIYTSYKIFMIQKSTAMVNRNQTNTLWKKYVLFLRLYLLMGAPWFFGMLMACLNQLWILKTCRIVQPILWLLMLVTHKKVRRRIADKLGFSKSDQNQSCENCVE